MTGKTDLQPYQIQIMNYIKNGLIYKGGAGSGRKTIPFRFRMNSMSKLSEKHMCTQISKSNRLKNEPKQNLLIIDDPLIR